MINRSSSQNDCKVRFFINTSAAWLLKLADDISKSVAHQHHRMLGFKSEEAGLSRAKAGIMRRLPGVVLVDARGADNGQPAQHLARGGAERNHREAAHDTRLGAG